MAMGKRERGLTFISWLVVFAVAGVFLLVIMKLVPIYIEHNAIRAGMRAVAADTAPGASLGAVQAAMEKHLGINDVKIVDRSDFELIKDGPTTYLEVEYEARTGLLGNLSLVVSFSESFPLGGSGE